MKQPLFKEEDVQQILTHGLTEAKVQQQLDTFRKGIPSVKLLAAAGIDEGIVKMTSAQQAHYIAQYEQAEREVVKFVPASGAATRMFKLLKQFANAGGTAPEQLKSLLKEERFAEAQLFFDRLQTFPFYDALCTRLKEKYPEYLTFPTEQRWCLFLRFLLNEEQYDALPKGLIPFHRYKDAVATPFEEHIREAAAYAGHNGVARLHFTITKAHKTLFEEAFEAIRPNLTSENMDFKVTYSVQKKATDTLAVHEDNTPFRQKDGRLLFRPGGHGALLHNLNALETDLIFIKNIDNVVTADKLPLVTHYKKCLGGLLVALQDLIFNLLQQLEAEGMSSALKTEAEDIVAEYFGKSKKFTSAAAIKTFFNRPIRVCGMVKNQGAPGGGPFWVAEKEGTGSLQIVESAQMDTADPQQAAIVRQATHFNPVDVVCGVRNYRGEKFDLRQFANKDQGFITHKTKDGHPIKALEHPGLWNGGMAYWHTVFVEVPQATFNPVKTVFDLLKPGHQPHYESART